MICSINSVCSVTVVVTNERCVGAKRVNRVGSEYWQCGVWWIYSRVNQSVQWKMSAWKLCLLEHVPPNIKYMISPFSILIWLYSTLHETPGLAFSSLMTVIMQPFRLETLALENFQLNFSCFLPLVCFIGNILDSMLLRASSKEAVESGKETSGSTAPALSSQRLLWCHCYHHCPEDSTNNTCR